MENVTPGNAVIEQDYIELGGTINLLYVNDEADALEHLQTAQKELEAIQVKVNSKLPGILSQLPATTPTTQ